MEQTANRHRVTVRRSGLTDGMRGQSGTATFWGHASNGEDLYRVVFGAPGYEHSHVFRVSDLTFDETAN